MKLTIGRFGQVFMVLLIVITSLVAGAFVVTKVISEKAEVASKWANEKAWNGLEVSNELVVDGYQDIASDKI